MAIFDCFQYFNEDHMVDLRMNILNDGVDFFVISESTRTHQGENKKLNFNIENFKKYKHKIIYTIADFKKDKNFLNHQGGESLIEQHQRNNILNGLTKADENDLIILSDSDEIPDLKKINQIKKSTKFTAFSQKMFMYKLNLQNLDESNWIGSKVCLKRDLPKPQKLRDYKLIAILNLSKIQNIIDKPKNEIKANLNLKILKEKKLINKKFKKLKILGSGEIKNNIEISAHFASKQALTKIEKAGGKISIVKK